MTPKDLKLFDICKLRNGTYAIVLPNSLDETYGLGLFDTDMCVGYLGDYTDNFIKNLDNCSHYDIMGIFRFSSAYVLLQDFFNDKFDFKIPSYHKPIWQRTEPKKLTIKEISKLLGYEVEIVA